jgi:hypothetical protein
MSIAFCAAFERFQKGAFGESGDPWRRGCAHGREPNATTAFDNFGQGQFHQHHAVFVCNVIGVLAGVLPVPKEFGP